MNLFKRKPKEETVSKAEHEQVLAEKDQIIDGFKLASAQYQRERDEAYDRLEGLTRSTDDERRTWISTSIKLSIANARLREIAALETPNCAHIGKKMARIARGEDQSRDKQQAEVGA